MNAPQILNFYLPAWKHADVANPATIFGKVAAAAQEADWRLRLRDESDDVGGAGFHLVYNRAVTHPNCLSLRRCYFEPFFRLEQTNDRWDWQVAHLTYDPGKGEEWFRRYWLPRLIKDREITKQGYVFMPLQGRLTDHRHFQSMSPIAMIKAAIKADPDRPIMASLHPRESYTPAEMQALAAIKGPFTLTDTPSMDLLAGCDYVVTQNSSMALIGMFAQKPAVLFADIDFHHIAASVPKMGIKAAYDHVKRPQNWGHYLHWFFRGHALSVHHDDVISQLRARFRAHGWPM